MDRKAPSPAAVKDEGLTVIVDPGDSTEFDVIFVHDFGDGPRRTWATSNLFWPEEVLPKEVPNARVLLYGYSTKRSLNALPQLGSNLLTTVQEDRKKNKIKGRPMIFVCHGLGGLICKNAIIAAGNTKTAQRFLATCTRGIIFLGTPHRGSKASLQAKITRIVRTLSTDQRAAVPNGRSSLWDQLNGFPHIMDKYQIPVECFYETSSSQVVEEASATMGRGERTHALNTTHVEMCRFKEPTDPGLVCILACIKRLCTLPKNISKPDEKYAIPVTLPFARNINFCGRGETLDRIHRKFWPKITNDTLSPLGRDLISLVGSNGAGKSQVLLEYVYRYHLDKPTYSSIFWLDADSSAQLEASAYLAVQSIIDHYQTIWKATTDCDQRIAHALKIYEPPIMTRSALLDAVNNLSSVELLKGWLSHEVNNRWLLIIDGYDPDAFNLDVILPTSESGHIIVSTSQTWAYPGSFLVSVPDGIGETESVDLLIRSCGKAPGTISRNDLTTAAHIIKMTSPLPLALDQAGAYMSYEGLNLQKYARQLKVELEPPGSKSSPGKQAGIVKNRLDTLWEMSWIKLSANAKRLIQLCSLISNENIPLKLLQGGKRDIEWMQDDQAIMKAIGKLLALSLISMKPDESSFSIHPLLHRWVRKDLEKDQDLLLETRKAVTYMVTSSFVFDDDATTGWSYERRVLPHIECCTELFVIQMNGYGEFMDDRDREVAYSLARAYERLSNLQKAGSLYLRALKFVNPDTASPPDLKIMDAYAVNLQTQGKLEEALTWYTQALQRAEQTIGPTNPLTLAIIQHIAKLHVEQGLYDVAVTEYKRVLEALDAKKKNHPRTLKIRYQLALVYTEQGEHATALELLQKVREAREKSPSLGPSHTATLETLESIAKIHERQEKYVEALDVQQLLLERKAASLGQNHRSTLETLDAMASVYERQGRYLEALSCHEMVLDGLSKLFGTAEHPWTFGIVARMGGVFLHLGQYADAEREYRKAYSGFRALGMEVRELEIATRVGEVLRLRCQYSEALDWSRLAETGLQEKLGRDHISTAVAKFCSARTLDLQGDYAAANKLYQQVITDYTAHAGPQHQSVLAATAAVATSLTKQGQFAKAAQHFSTVLVQQEKLLGSNHTDTLASVQGHAILRGETGHYDQSLQLHQRVFTGLSQALGKSHPETIRASYHLATAFENKLQLTDASKYYNIAISGMPADHHYAMLAQMGMGNVHRLSERFDQAFSLYSTVLADMKQRLGNRHPDTMRCQCFLAATMVKLARFPEAEAMGAEALRGCEETLGRDHPLTLEAVHVHAKAVSKQKKRHKEAQAGFARAKEGREKLLTKQHRDTMLSAREVKKVKRKSWGWFF